ncbi:MAG: GNAT family N-acetyltransferase [Terricaulis sp.]
MDVPVLETPRLIMRGHRLADFDATAELWANADVVRYISGKSFTREESWPRFLRHVGHWAIMGHGYWVVEHKETGRFVGEVGFGEFKRDIEPSLDGVPELGWILSPWAHGAGYATEAARAAIAWGNQNLAEKSIACLIDPDNAGSIRVAEKCGFREVARAISKGLPVIMFRR